MYVDYQYYNETYGGTLVTASDFQKYELKARLLLDSITLKPDQTEQLLETNLADYIKVVMCELIDNLKQEEEALLKANTGDLAFYGGIGSETVKDHTVSFKTGNTSVSNNVEKDFAERRKRIINKLAITGLLYRGVSQC